MLILYLSPICLLVTTAAASNLYGDEIVKPTVVACAAVTCLAGQHCEEINGQVSCVEDQLEPASSCAGIVCNAADQVCVEENGPRCVAIGEMSTQQPIVVSSCATVTCPNGQHCEVTNGQASCAEGLPSPVVSCAVIQCNAPGTVCVEDIEPRCVPITDLVTSSTLEPIEGVTGTVTGGVENAESTTEDLSSTTFLPSQFRPRGLLGSEIEAEG